MFCASQADTCGAKGDGIFGLLGRVGIGADIELGDFRAPIHELLEVFNLLGFESGFVAFDETGDDLGGRGFELSGVDAAGGAVDREEVAFLEDFAFHGDRAGVVVDLEGCGAADANLAHLTGNESGVRGDAAFCSEDAFGGDHATEVFGRCLGADEQDFFTFLGGFDSALGVHVDLAGSSARAGGKAGGDDFGFLGFGDVEHRSEELVELIGGVAKDRGLPVDELLFHHVHRELERGHGGALAVAGLEHEQFAFLHGELHVLHILVVLLEDGADFHEFGIRLRHGLLELADWLRCAHAGDDIFTLGVDEELAVEFVGAIGRVAGECHAGS